MALNSEVGEVALALYCATVRATLFVCKGYECQEKEGVFMTAFPGPIKALEWAVTLQMALLRQALLFCTAHRANCDLIHSFIKNRGLGRLSSPN